MVEGKRPPLADELAIAGACCRRLWADCIEKIACQRAYKGPAWKAWCSPISGTIEKGRRLAEHPIDADRVVFSVVKGRSGFDGWDDCVCSLRARLTQSQVGSGRAARFSVSVPLNEPPEDLMRLDASAVIEIEK
jgi:hypothetical protein